MEDILDEEFIEEEIEYKPIEIYYYGRKTREYIGSDIAKTDPEETRRQGKFVPLLSAFSTLVQPPEFEENQIPVYHSHIEEQTIATQEPIYDETGEITDYEEKNETIKILVENWTVEKDLRKNFYIVDENLNIKDITEIGEVEGLIVSKELGDKIKANPERYKISEGEVIEKTAEEIASEQKQKERERINSLKMTKRVFALGLQQLGISYQQLKELIASNEQAQLEWDLCVELERSNPLLDVMAEEIGVTPAQLDIMFRKANGEEVEIPPIAEAEPEVEVTEDKIESKKSEGVNDEKTV